MASKNPYRCSSLDDCKGEIYQLYIAEDIPLTAVVQKIEENHGIKATPAMYKKRFEKWEFRKNIKRTMVLAALRDEHISGGRSKGSTVHFHNRPPNLGKIEKFRKRNQIRKPIVETYQTADSIPMSASESAIIRSNQRIPVLGLLASPQVLRASEKFISDMGNYIRGSFEAKDWMMNGTEQIIISSKSQESDVHTLHSFMTALDTGCSNFALGNRYAGGLYWRKAFMDIEPLVQGQYHNIIPNIILKINDLNESGHPQFAEALKKHVAHFGATQRLTDSSIRAFIYKGLADIGLDQMRNLEEMMMACLSDLFELYLGDRCYNSFVMKMDKARRKLSQGNWVDISDNLPALSILDNKFGPCDRRPLDVIRLRIETLYQRKQYEEARAHSSMLISRADRIENDEWQRHYFLIKGLYFAGASSHHIPDQSFDAESKLSRCFGLIEDFYQLSHNFAMFDTEKIDIIERMEQLSTMRLDEESYKEWNARRSEFQERLNAIDNTSELFEALQLQK